MNKQTTTNNIKALNKDVEIIKKHFSHCFDKNGNFDLEKFKNELSKNEIDFSNESYGMDWLGKSYARLLASDEATTLLKEDEKWNDQPQNTNSQNLLIKGDNLEVLKHLSSAYYEKVKMIYIDPPYNTGGDGFVYQDDRKFTVEEFRKLAGVDEEKAKRILDFVDSKSNSHSAWLTFMYPRLYIAKQLLKDDGVIFISIDENEFAQLKLLCDEVFGEENFAGDIVWKNSSKNDQAYVSIQHEYILAYVKSKVHNSGKWQELKEGLSEIYKAFDGFKKQWGSDWEKIHKEALKWYGQFPDSNPIKDSKHYNWLDEKGVYFAADISGPNFGQYVYDVVHPITGKVCKSPASGWRYPESTIKQRINEGLVHFGDDHTVIPKNKVYLSETEYQSLTSIKFKDGRIASNLLTKLFGVKDIFTNPKDAGILISLMKAINLENDELVLDFFAGSGTTGDAVIQLNAEDGGSRRYILVQLAEEIDKKKAKVAYDFVKNELRIEQPTIFDITKERLIRAGKKIQKDNKDLKEPKDLSNVDFGFKIFETTPIWDGYDIDAEDFDSQMELFNENRLSDENLQTLLTTWKTYDGVPLTQNVVAIDLDGYTAYYLDTRVYLMNKGFITKNLKKLLDEIDVNNDFNPRTIIVFGYNFESKMLRELAENIKNYANKKEIDIDFIARY